MTDLSLSSPVTALRGVGPRRASALAAAGITDVEALLAFLPARHEDRRTLSPLSSLAPGDRVVARGVVRGVSGRPAARGRSVLRAVIEDDTGRCDLVFFNQPYRREQLVRGERVYIAGAVVEGREGAYLVNPDVATDPDSIGLGRLLPIYQPPEGIPAGPLRAWIESAAHLFEAMPSPSLPGEAPTGRAWPTRGEALEACHFPTDEAAFERGCERLRFEELFAFQCAIAARRARFVGAAACDLVTNASLRAVVRGLPFELTAGQARALEEIAADLRASRPMYRLLHGDVGSGKTAVAMAAAGLAVLAGAQCVVMAPTEVLADQWCREAGRLLGSLDVSVRAFTARLSAAERRAIVADVAAGSVGLVVGTHAVLSESLRFHDLGLVVVDEEQRFGVRQRDALRGKGPAPHVLVLSATPIPRTLALTAYGDLDVTTIPDRPPGRVVPRTFLVEPARAGRAWSFVADRARAGGRAFVVCPSIEGEADEARSVRATASSLTAGPFADVSVGRLHGRMSAEEKRDVVRAFAAGDLRVLVTTTVVEVGVDVPAADVMIVRGPDRFGLAQLHQLRGRVGRGGQESYCLLMLEGSEAPAAAARLETFRELDDGFEVAEADLEQRGPGELLGVRQHGLPKLAFADPRRDAILLERARAAAFAANGIPLPGADDTRTGTGPERA